MRSDIMDSAVRDDMLAAIPKLTAFAISLCRNRDQANDLVQEALLRGCANIKRFDPGTNMTAWLFTILRNQFYSDCRKRRVFEPIELHAHSMTEAPAQVVRAEHADVQLAMMRLRPEDRDALLLIAASGLSYGAAAKVCGCAIGTIKSRVHRARARLADLLSYERLPPGPSALTATNRMGSRQPPQQGAREAA
jgi:RNA polymerase sigma-70 factor (ECF subfamily)